MLDWLRILLGRKPKCFGIFSKLIKCKKFGKCPFTHQCNNAEIKYRFENNIPQNLRR